MPTEIPNPEDHRLQDLLRRREAALEQERALRSDAEFRNGLSAAAKAACAIVDKIRRHEHETLWTNDFENSLAEQDGDIFPGMMFILAKERMEKSKLYKIIRDMPKGALLHCHLEAMVDIPWLLSEAFKIQGIHIQAQAPLNNPQALAKTPFVFQYVPSKRASQLVESDIWSTSYEPNTLVPLNKAVEAFPDGGQEGFISWVKSRCTITPQESVSHHHGPNDIWRKFGSCFPILSSIINYEPVFRKFIFKMCQELRRDGVQWVDIRSVMSRSYYREGAEEPDEDLDAKLTAMEEAIQAACSTGSDNEMPRENSRESERVPKQNMPPFWGARFIWTSMRSSDQASLIKDMKMCIAMKLKHPEIIAGYDLVGQEDLGRPLTDLLPEIYWFLDACKEAGVYIPFFFHAGETLGTGDETDNNVHTAILLGTRRIGHGFSLYKHPTLVEAVKEKRILIESCPISNEVLRYTSSIMSHPLPALLARGVPVSLSNDDPAILGQGVNGMTHDFWQVLQGWENMGLAGLGSLAQNSVRWATFENLSDEQWLQEIKLGSDGHEVRAQRIKQWNYEWELFCLRVIDRYGDDGAWDEIVKDPQVQALLKSSTD